MKKVQGGIGAGIVATALIGPPPPASAATLTDRPAEVDLGVSAQGPSQTDIFIPTCSYNALTKKAASTYTALTR